MPDITIINKFSTSSGNVPASLYTGELATDVDGKILYVGGVLSGSVNVLVNPYATPLIGSGAITSGMIGDSAVVSGNIASGQIQQPHLGTITSPTSGAVLTTDGTQFDWAIPFSLSSGCVQSGMIADNAVVSGSIASGQVGQYHLSDNSVYSGAVASGQLGQYHLSDNSVYSGAIASGQVGKYHLSDNSVYSGAIASGQIQQSHLGTISAPTSGYILTTDGNAFDWIIPNAGTLLTSGVVTSGYLGDNSVVSGSIASGQVGQYHLSDNSVYSGAIALGQVGQYHLSDNSVYSGAIASGQLGQYHLSDNSVYSGNIASGQIQQPHLGTISAPTSGYILTTDGNAFDWIVVPSTFSLSSGIITSGYLGDNSVVSGSIASGQISQYHLSDNSVYSGAIASGQIQQPHLGTISAPTSGYILTTDGSSFDWIVPSAGFSLTSGVVTSGYLGDNSVVSGSIASGQIGQYHLSDNSVYSGAIASGQVGQYHLGTISAPTSGYILTTDGIFFDWIVPSAGFSLTSGVVTSGYLGDNTVVSGSIASGQVGQYHLSANSVYSGAIASGQVGRYHLSNNSIYSGAIASGQINTFNLASGIVNSGHYAPTSIASGVIASGQINRFNLASGIVNSGHYAPASIASGVIASGQINRFNLASGIVNSGHYSPASIASGVIASGQINTFNLASGIVNSGHITTNAVNSGNISANSVISGSIASGQIGTYHFGSTTPTSGYFLMLNQNLALTWSTLPTTSLTSGQVTSGYLGNNSVVSGSIASGQIGQYHLSANAVNSGHIAANSIASGVIASGQINTFNLASGIVNSGHYAPASIASGAIASGQINTFNLASGIVNSGHYAPASIASGAIASGQINTFNLASGIVNSGHFAPNSITSGIIASGQIGLNSLSSGVVRSGHINVNSINSGNISANSVISGSIASGQIGTYHLGSTTPTSGYFLQLNGTALQWNQLNINSGIISSGTLNFQQLTTQSTIVTDHLNNFIGGESFNWVAVTLPATRTWTDVAAGMNMYVAVDSGTNAPVYSYDGINWSNCSVFGTVYAGNKKIVYVESMGTWVIVQDGGLSVDYYSYDGINFTTYAISSPIFDTLYNIRSVGTKCVALGVRTATTGVWASSHLTARDFTQVTMPTPAAGNWKDVAYGAGKYIFIQSGSTDQIQIWDGSGTFTTAYLPAAITAQYIIYGNGIFLITNSASTTQYISYDGLNWTAFTTAITNTWYPIYYGGQFLLLPLTGGSTAAERYIEGGLSTPSGWTAPSISYGGICVGADAIVIVPSTSSATGYRSPSRGRITLKCEWAGEIDNLYIGRQFPQNASFKNIYVTSGIYGNKSFAPTASGTVGLFSVTSGAITSGAIASGQIGWFHVGNEIRNSITRINDFRIGVQSGVSITSTDQASQSTIYLNPYTGDNIGLWNGSSWQLYNTSGTCVSLAITGLTSGKLYDIYASPNGVNPQLTFSTAWTTDNVRADTLTYKNGTYVLSTDNTKRLIGTIRASSPTTTEDTLISRYIANYDNQVPRPLFNTDSTSHTYSSTVARIWNNTSGNQIFWVQSVAGVGGTLSIWGGVARTAGTGFSILDATTNAAAGAYSAIYTTSATTEYQGAQMAHTQGVLGYNYAYPQERNTLSGTLQYALYRIHATQMG